MFDTRSRFKDNDGTRKPVDHAISAVKPNSNLDTNEDASTYCDSDNDSDSDSGTDDGIDAGLDETGCLLWRHITLIIAPPGGPSILFTKVTLAHTKGEDNSPRE